MKSARDKFIEMKMRKMKGENKPHDQKVAIALSYAKKAGYKIPK